jgi:hypothetical protein
MIEILLVLSTLDERIVGEPGKVFSTDPRVALGPDGRTYFVKGADMTPSLIKKLSDVGWPRCAGLRCRKHPFARSAETKTCMLESRRRPMRSEIFARAAGAKSSQQTAKIFIT